MKNEISSNLLPVGFYDLLFDEAELNHKNIGIALDVFFAAGYRLIKPTLVEFERSLSHNSNSCRSENYFRIVDVISGKNLALRSDITAQISRLLATRFKSEKLPLKLCYVGDVLQVENDDLYADRQQTQLGLELIGDDAEKFNFEVIETLLFALQKITETAAQKKFLIEFSSLNFLEIFLDEIEKDENRRADLCDAIMKKNLSLIKKFANENADLISNIVVSNRDPKKLFSEIKSAIKSERIVVILQKKLTEFEKISAFIAENFPQIEVRFDLFGDHKSSYTYDISFDIFYGNFPYAIARGGSYEINNMKATGATIYMNHLRKI